MNTLSIQSREFEGFYYVVTSDGVFGKGCSRCGGTGHYSFNGFDSICYKCNNIFSERLGDTFEDEAAAQKWCHERAVRKGQADRKREAKRLAKIAARDAAWQALKDAHPMVWDLVSGVVGATIPFDESKVEYSNERDTFVLKLADQLWSLDERTYTERQIAALQRVADQRVARAAEAAEHPAPEGRIVVTGEITSAKVVSGEYGDSYKVLVKADEGYKVWTTIPSALIADLNYFEFTEAVKGRRITFTATLKPSDDDKSFAFGSRPTKGAWL